MSNFFIFQLSRGSSNLEVFKADKQWQSIAGHAFWQIPVTMETLKPWKKGKATSVTNSINVRVIAEVRNINKSSFNSLINFCLGDRRPD